MGACGLLLVLAFQAADGADRPFASFDRTMERFMEQRSIPGGALAVVRDGRLVYARGYGRHGPEDPEKVTPRSLFRIASISKPVTAVAVVALARKGRLDLDAKAFDLLGVETPGDPRLEKITVLQLLQHTGGWDRKRSGDPMFMSLRIARAEGVAPPAGPKEIIRYMATRPLDFDPGTRYAYSNFGYCVLGRIIEKVTGEEYGEHVRGAVLKPMAITGMRLGRSLAADRAPGEVRYHQPDAKPARPVFTAMKEETVPWPYGGFNLEAMDAHGGWLASAVDLARFATRIDRVLDAKGREQLFARPAGLEEKAWYYGCGWLVRPVGTKGGRNTWHNGSLPGTYTLLVRRHDGLAWVVLFNRRSSTDGEIDGALHRAADAVPRWPEGDLFDRYR